VAGKKPERSQAPPATTPELREQQIVAAAVNLAEQQIVDGTASAQVITHFLKLGSTREQLEQDRLRSENELLKARVEALSQAGRMEELTREALIAFRSYSGQDVEDVFDD